MALGAAAASGVEIPGSRVIGRECSGRAAHRAMDGPAAAADGLSSAVARRAGIMAIAITCNGCGRRHVLLFVGVDASTTCRECGATARVSSDAERVDDPFGLRRFARPLRIALGVGAPTLLLMLLVLAVGSWLHEDGSERIPLAGVVSVPEDGAERSAWLRRIQARMDEAARTLSWASSVVGVSRDGEPEALIIGARIDRWRLERVLREAAEGR
jgi:hypothetical protein